MPGNSANTDTITALCDYFEIEPVNKVAGRKLGTGAQVFDSNSILDQEISPLRPHAACGRDD